MRIVVAENYILRFGNVKKYNAMALKIARIALNMPKSPENGSVISIKASELNSMLGITGKSLYNKHMEYKKSLEGLSLYDDNGNILLDDFGDPVRPFRIVAYNKGVYKFDINPKADVMTSEKRKYIYYDSRNLKSLKTTYSIALYEQLKFAQLKDIKPMLILKKEDLSEQNTSNDLNDLKRTLERAVKCVNETDLQIVETDFSEKTICIYAQSRAY